MERRITWVLLLLAVSACSYREEKTRIQDGRLTGEGWYAWIDRTVFVPRCVECHGGAKVAARVDLSSYKAVMESRIVTPGEPERSPLYEAVLENRMPKGPALSAGQIERIKAWILAGAPGNTDDVEPTPIPEPKPEATYAWLAKNLFEPRCLRCHTGEKAKGDVDLSTYQSLMASEGLTLNPVEPGEPQNSGLWDQVEAELMPPGPDKVSNDIRAALAEWIRKGAPGD